MILKFFSALTWKWKAALIAAIVLPVLWFIGRGVWNVHRAFVDQAVTAAVKAAKDEWSEKFDALRQSHEDQDKDRIEKGLAQQRKINALNFRVADLKSRIPGHVTSSADCVWDDDVVVLLNLSRGYGAGSESRGSPAENTRHLPESLSRDSEAPGTDEGNRQDQRSDR